MEKQDKYIGIINIHGKWNIQESCDQESAEEFVISELQYAKKNFPHYEDFQGRVLKICEETLVLPSDITTKTQEST